jgi:hypothetical protein
MSISAISSPPAFVRPAAAPAADGDTPAQEARETSATKTAEKLNGGFAPPPTAPSPSAGGGKVDVRA